MIKTVPMANALGAGMKNNFVMPDVFYFLDHCSNGGKKDASYISSLFLPLIKNVKEMKDLRVS